MTHNSFSGPISRKFQWKYASFTIIFLHVRNKYSPDPEFCIFLGLRTNFVCYRYKKHLKMLCFTAKPLIFFQADIFFYICPKLSEQQQLFLGSWARGIEPATRKGLALTGLPGNAKIPDPDGSFSNNCSWVLRRRDDYPGHCLRFMSRLADGLEYLYHGRNNPTKKMIDPKY